MKAKEGWKVKSQGWKPGERLIEPAHLEPANFGTTELFV